MILLDKVHSIMITNGYKISNIDTTIVLETPKIRPFVPEMAHNLAQVLHLAGKDLSIKAKTNEGMGFIGRNEGIAVFAVVILEEV